MAEIINLRAVRKAKEKAADRAQADANVQRAGDEQRHTQQHLHQCPALFGVALAVDDEGLLQDLADRVAAVEGFCRILKHHLHISPPTFYRFYAFTDNRVSIKIDVA